MNPFLSTVYRPLDSILNIASILANLENDELSTQFYATDRKFDVRHGWWHITYNRSMGTNSLFGAECTGDQLIYVEQWVGQNVREGASVESACQMADGRGQFFLATVSFRRYTGPLGSNALETTIVIPWE